MEKKKKRGRLQNPQPFIPGEEDNGFIASSKKRSKLPKHHQKQEKMISSGISSKILKEALIQQREIQEEAEDNTNPANIAFAAAAQEDAERHQQEQEEDEDNVDDFSGFSDTQAQLGDYDEIDEAEEKLLEAFLSKDAGPQCTLADIIVEKIKQQEGALVSSETQPLPKLDESLIDLYNGVGEFLNGYTAGEMPKAFKHIPSMQLWEDILYLTKPEKWSPNAMYQAT